MYIILEFAIRNDVGYEINYMYVIFQMSKTSRITFVISLNKDEEKTKL